MNNLIKKFLENLLSANTPMILVIKWCGKKYWTKENSLDIAKNIYQKSFIRLEPQDGFPTLPKSHHRHLCLGLKVSPQNKSNLSDDESGSVLLL